MRAYIHGGLSTPTASQHNTFDAEKTLSRFSCAHDGVGTPVTDSIDSWVRCSTNWTTPSPHITWQDHYPLPLPLFPRSASTWMAGGHIINIIYTFCLICRKIVEQQKLTRFWKRLSLWPFTSEDIKRHDNNFFFFSFYFCLFYLHFHIKTHIGIFSLNRYIHCWFNTYIFCYLYHVCIHLA